MINERDQQMIIDIHNMATEFENNFLRQVADRMHDLVKENARLANPRLYEYHQDKKDA
jgi:hypothetical protein